MNFFIEFFNKFNLPLKDPILVMSVILVIILLSPILMRKLKAPAIIGLILAGVLVGPHGFNVLAKNSFVDIFSTIGLLYIMFIAGLELDLNEFKENKNKSLLFGLYTFAIPLAIGYPVVHYFLGYDFNTSFLTASMFATHTLVAYPIVSRLGVSKNQAVATAVGGTILTDTAVLIILAVILGNAKGGLSQEFWIRLGVSLVAFSLVMFFVVPRIAKWFFTRFEKERHLHYVFVLAVVFFAAFLAEASSLEAIIGAFAAGLALNKLIPSSSALMNRIEFIGNSLFIPFFLISVGMLVDVSVIFNGWGAWIVAGALTTVAVSGKWLAALFTQKSFRYTTAQRQVIFGLSGAHAAATLAVILVGYQAGILDNAILNGTIILILITCLLASLVTERAGKVLKIESENDTEALMKSSGASSEQILLAISEVENIEKLLELAILIKDKNSQHPISILSVVDNNKEAEVNIVKAKAGLETFVKEASATETEVNVLATIDENKANGITRISREITADIIILDWIKQSVSFGDLVGIDIQEFVNSINKSIYICHISKPLALHTKMHIMVPPHAEEEKSFDTWILKMSILAQELSSVIAIYCSENTEKTIKKIFKENKIKPATNFSRFTSWEDFFVLARYIETNDLIVLISARKGTVSFVNELTVLPDKFEKYFPDNSYLVIYPEQTEPFAEIVKADDNNPIYKIGREIGSIFKRN